MFYVNGKQIERIDFSQVLKQPKLDSRTVNKAFAWRISLVNMKFQLVVVSMS